MRAKLIKTGESFLLKDVNNETLAITSGTMQGRMLSLKNCQAIERGYDLDELANELLYSKYPFHPSNDSGYWLDMYKEGFQKALELMGDKKFSEQDVRNAYFNGEKDSYVKGGQTKDMENEFIQSLQQTEWDVEVEMEYRKVLVNGYKNQPANVIGFVADYEKQLFPKLDGDGCLILKLKSE